MNMDSKKPKVTVLMPVYDGEKYLREAVESILSQTFADFEFLIIDDGSTDRSAKIIKSYKDERIKFVSNGANKGLPYSLNLGLSLARGQFIARMDSDDISLPKRLERQVDFMEKRPEISVCGSWVKTIGTKKDLTHKFFTEHDDIKAGLLFNTSLCHPTVMMRKSELDKNHLDYNCNHLHFEDYALWVKFSNCGKMANLPEVLMRYRLHPASVSRIHDLAQEKGASVIRKEQLEKLGLEPSIEDMRVHNTFNCEKTENINEFLKKRENWLIKIVGANKDKKIYNEKSLSKIMDTRWYLICRSNVSGGISVWLKFVSSDLLKIKGVKQISDCVKILLKCL